MHVPLGCVKFLENLRNFQVLQQILKIFKMPRILIPWSKDVGINFSRGGFRFKKNFPTRKKKNFVCRDQAQGGERV